MPISETSNFMAEPIQPSKPEPKILTPAEVPGETSRSRRIALHRGGVFYLVRLKGGGSFHAVCEKPDKLTEAERTEILAALAAEVQHQAAIDAAN